MQRYRGTEVESTTTYEVGTHLGRHCCDCRLVIRVAYVNCVEVGEVTTVQPTMSSHLVEPEHKERRGEE